MANKQSNKQTQSVKVVVNNKISSNCCNDKKKKRKPKKKPQEQEEAPQEVNEFPVLDTPANTRYPQGGISHMAVRNTVYLPNTAQITPEGMQYPIPPYFERQYTNLTRTMEDFRETMMKEMQDVRNLVSVKPVSNVGTQTVTDMETQTEPEINKNFANDPFSSPVKQNVAFYNNLANKNIPIEEDEELFVPDEQEEEPFVSQSPEQDGMFSKLTKLFSNWEKTAIRSTEREQALEELRNYASDFKISIKYKDSNGNQKMKSAQQLKADITKKIKSIV